MVLDEIEKHSWADQRFTVWTKEGEMQIPAELEAYVGYRIVALNGNRVHDFLELNTAKDKLKHLDDVIFTLQMYVREKVTSDVGFEKGRKMGFNRTGLVFDELVKSEIRNDELMPVESPGWAGIC